MKLDASPTARALLALELIQASPGITADRLAGKLGVSERAARRYAGLLREAGIPVESVRGPHGGYRIDRVGEVQLLEDHFSPPAGLDPAATLEEHLAAGWEYDVEVIIDAPLETVTRCLPRALGRLEPFDAQGTRLTGSTSNPVWYTRQLAAIPASYRIIRCPELQDAARALGQRLLAAGIPGP